MVAPWRDVWDHNRFVEARPALEAILNSPYARGGVTGIGVITAIAGLIELGSLVAPRPGRRQDGGEPPAPPPAP